MLALAARAFRRLWARDMVAILLGSMLATGCLFAALLGLAEWAIATLPVLGYEWVNTGLAWVTPVLFVLLAIVLGPPVAALVIGLFLETIAGRVEQTDFPADPPARGSPFWLSLRIGLGYGLLSLALNLPLIAVHLVFPVVGTILVTAVNAILIGREFFYMVALRHRDWPSVQVLRGRFGWRIYTAGFAASLFASIPVLGLLASVFGTILMVYVFKGIVREETV